jgi:hypothetical protein
MTFLQDRGKETTVNDNYEWMRLYEAAVLETNHNILPGRIENSGIRNRTACSQECNPCAIDEADRSAVVNTLNALADANSFRHLYYCEESSHCGAVRDS